MGDTWKFLASLMLKDGMLTGSEPLLINFPLDLIAKRSPPAVQEEQETMDDGFGEVPQPVQLWSGSLPTFSVGYVKGFTRTETLLALLRWLQKYSTTDTLMAMALCMEIWWPACWPPLLSKLMLGVKCALNPV